MTRLRTRLLSHFLKGEEGVTAVECALMLALVALAPTATPTEPAPPPTVMLEVDQG